MTRYTLKELRNKPTQKNFKSSGVFDCLTGKIETQKISIVRRVPRKLPKPRTPKKAKGAQVLQVKRVKILVIAGAKDCPKCHNEMQRREHVDIPLKAFYYTKWDYCKPCGHIQHYEEFKSGAWKEVEQNQAHFSNI